jgi:hypothetical protein
MPYSPISVRQINQEELLSFVSSIGQGSVSSKKYINESYTVSQNDYFICVNASGSQKTLTFPQTGFLMGREYIVKDFLGLSQTNPIILTGSGITFDYQPSLTISGNFASIYLVGGSGFNYEVN